MKLNKLLLTVMMSAIAISAQAKDNDAVKLNNHSISGDCKDGTQCAKAVDLHLFNTGVNGNGGVLNKNADDPDFQVSINGAPAVNSQVGTTDINGNWLATSSVSAWVTPYQNANQSLDANADGKYVYTETFTLSGLNDFASLSIAGRWAADNYGVMKLNGHEVSVISKGTGASQYDNFKTWHDFTISDYFVNGTNTFTWEVTNTAQASGNPSGLRVEFGDVCVTALPVPEPDSYAMILAGLGLMGFVARRRV